MLKKSVFPRLLSLICLMVFLTSCSWFQNNETYACQTCRAYPANGQEITEDVCSSSAERDFRRRYSDASPYCHE